MAGGNLHVDGYASIIASVGTDKNPVLMHKIFSSWCRTVLPSAPLLVIKQAVVSQLQIHTSSLFFAMLRLGLYKFHFYFEGWKLIRLC